MYAVFVANQGTPPTVNVEKLSVENMAKGIVKLSWSLDDELKGEEWVQIYYSSGSTAFDDSNNVWQDALGNANSSSVSGNPTLQNLSGQSSRAASDIDKAVYFDTGDKMRWSHLTVGNSNDYTLFHVARYADSGTSGRVFDGNGHNWLSGFWSGRSGVAYHNGWLNSTNRWNRNWVLSVDRKNWYRSKFSKRNWN